MFEDGVEVIYVRPHAQPIFVPDDEESDIGEVACLHDFGILRVMIEHVFI